MNQAFIILAILDFMAELFHLTFQLGALTRRYGVPALIALYVVVEMGWDNLTSQEWTVKFHATPLTTGFA